MTTKEQEVFRVASELYRQRPDWVTFFREVMGMEGVVRRAFVTPDEIAAFERTPEYKDIQKMIESLRSNPKSSQPVRQEPTTVITVRLPKTLHDALKHEAHEHRTSMNKLCIAKLLQSLERPAEPARTERPMAPQATAPVNKPMTAPIAPQPQQPMAQPQNTQQPMKPAQPQAAPPVQNPYGFRHAGN